MSIEQQTPAARPADPPAGAARPPPVPPADGGAPAAAPVLLQTRDLLSGCTGPGADWLLAADGDPQAAAAEAGSSCQPVAHASPGGAAKAGSAAAEFFQLTPLPELGEEQQAWQPAAWNEAADGAAAVHASALSFAAAAHAASRQGEEAAGERPGSGASVALSSPDPAGLAYPAPQAGGSAVDAVAQQEAGAAAAGGAGDEGPLPAVGPADSSHGSSRGGGPPPALSRVHTNAAYEPSAQGEGRVAEDGRDDSPAAQLARLLASPLTPDPAPSPGEGAGSHAGSSSSVGAARIAPWGSPADGSVEAGSGARATSNSDAGPACSAHQHAETAALQRQVHTLQQESAQLREALAEAEARAETFAEQAQLLRGQAAAAAERQAAAQVSQAQAAAALAAADTERHQLQQAAESAAEAVCEAQQREAVLQEQLALLTLERETAALGEGDLGLAATAADPAAGNALMAEVAVLRRQLEATATGKRQLAEALAAQRELSATMHARLAAAMAAQQHAADQHAWQVEEAAATAAARCGALAARAEQAEVQGAALRQQLADAVALAAASAGAARLQAEHATAAAEQSQSVAIADLQRQLHAERQARLEQQALADAAADQVTQQAAAFSQALLQQQQAAEYWRAQADELALQLSASGEAESDTKAALQETCTKLVSQQQLCHEQQEELQFLRAKYQELSSQLEVARAAAAVAEAAGAAAAGLPPAPQQQKQAQAAGAGSRRPPVQPPLQHPAVRELSQQGSLEQQPLERASPTQGGAGSGSSTPTGMHRSGSNGSRLSGWFGRRRTE